MLKRIKCHLDLLVLAGLILTIVPFLILSFFHHPQTDDFVYTARADEFGFIGANIWWYKVWSGRWLSTALLSINPLVYHSFFYYKMSSFITILFLFGALYFPIREFSSKTLTPRQVTISALAILSLYLYQLPDVVEGIFTIAGDINSELGIILTLVIGGLLIRISRLSQGLRRTGFKALVIFLVIAASGANEMTMMLILGILSVTFFFDAVLYRRVNGWYVLLICISLAASSIDLLAPGTQARFSAVPHDRLLAIKSSLEKGSFYLAQWFLFTPLVPIAILFAPIASKLPRCKMSILSHPATSLGLFTIVYYAQFYPSFYGAGTIEPRTVDLIYFYFLAGLGVNVYVITNYILNTSAKLSIDYPLPVILGLGALVVVMAVSTDSNVKTAYADLFSGAAYRYDRELNLRYETIAACKTPVCEVEPIKNKPASIYYFENAVDEAKDSAWYRSYKDGAMAACFHKVRIRLRPSP